MKIQVFQLEQHQDQVATWQSLHPPPRLLLLPRQRWCEHQQPDVYNFSLPKQFTGLFGFYFFAAI